MFRSRSMKGALLLSLPLTLGSCIADSVSLRISCNLVPDDECLYEPGNACYLAGALNLQGRTRYDAVLRVANGLKPRERDVPPRSEPNGVVVKELEIEITDSAGRRPSFARSLPNPFTVQATGDVEPGEDGVVGAELLPPPYVSALADLERNMRGLASLRLSIIVRGVTWGGVEVESAPWPWSIRLAALETTPGSPECVDPEAGTASEICTFGQDQWAGSCVPRAEEGG
jgi:hypothetical protein